MHVNDNKGKFPYSGWRPEAIILGTGMTSVFDSMSWDDLVAPYRGIKFSDRTAWIQDMSLTPELVSPLLMCPSDDVPRMVDWPGTSYLMVMGGSDGVGGVSYNTTPPFSRKIAQVRDSSRTLVLTEVHAAHNWAGSIDGNGGTLHNPSWQYFSQRALPRFNLPTSPVQRAAHGFRKGKIGDPVSTVNGIFNYAFADGHAETLSAWETYDHTPFLPGRTKTLGLYDNVGGSWTVTTGD